MHPLRSSPNPVFYRSGWADLAFHQRPSGAICAQFPRHLRAKGSRPLDQKNICFFYQIAPRFWGPWRPKSSTSPVESVFLIIL